MSRRKRVLILSYDYPPCSSPGAAVRTQKLVQYLPEFGWDAAVVCREEGQAAGSQPGEQKRGQKGEVMRIPTPVPSWFSYQLGAWAWAWKILPGTRASLRTKPPDVLYASCPPFAHALNAVRLAREAEIPLVLDFRDSWSLDPHASGGVVKQTAKRALCAWVYPGLERWVIEAADAVILNTPSMHREYVRRFPGAAARLSMAPNGFDEADFAGVVEPPARDRPLLLYCGRLSGVGGRTPDLLFRAVRAAIDQGCALNLEVLGEDSPSLRAAVERFGLENTVRLRPPVPHEEAIQAMREADVLVVYQAPGATEVTPIAGKTFEYLRAGRPILAFVPEGDNADLARRYAAVHAVVTSDDPACAAAAVREVIGEAAASLSPAPDSEFLATYSRRNLAGRIAAIFDAVGSASSRVSAVPVSAR